MNANDILDIIGDSPDKYVREAHESRSQRRSRRIFNAAIGIAACIVLAPTVIFGGMWLIFGGMGASAPAPGEAAGGDAISLNEYMSYSGPVLPLSFLEDSGGIQAQRHIDISFAPYSDSEAYPPSARVTDSYILSNSSMEDISLTAVYPYAASYSSAFEDGNVPQLRLNGLLSSVTRSDIVCGAYSGIFIPVYGAEDDAEVLTQNLLGPENFSDYSELLSDGSYLAEAFTSPEALDQKVTVYTLSDYEYSSDTEATNPTLNLSFTMDEERSSIFTWNFNGGSNFSEENRYERSSGGIYIRPNASPQHIYPGNAYLIVLGEDISDLSMQGYKTGACEKGNELSDLSAKISRRETSLGEILRELLEENMPALADSLYPVAAKALLANSSVGTEPVTRYSSGMLDSFIHDLMSQNRVCYLAFPVTVPAGESISLELSFDKEASFNYHGAGGDTSLNGYEFATVLGSSLAIESQKAEISDYDSIEIVSQNFGFDLESGLTEVELDSSTASYWLNIRRKAIGE